MPQDYDNFLQYLLFKTLQHLQDGLEPSYPKKQNITKTEPVLKRDRIRTNGINNFFKLDLVYYFPSIFLVSVISEIIVKGLKKF